jgi:SAM-dependent methyltransferase
MLALYRRHYRDRRAAIARLIAPGASVVEVCCGPGRLYTRQLRDVVSSYVGLDLSPAFVVALRRRGVDARVWDARCADPLPRADYVVMQASLYQFLPRPEPVLERMLAAARRAVVIAEPIRNLTSGGGRLGRLWAAVTDPGTGSQSLRFDEPGLDGLFAGYRELVERELLLPGGREKAYVLRGRGTCA